MDLQLSSPGRGTGRGVGPGAEAGSCEGCAGRRFSFELQLVADQPWNAYNWYLGGYKSLIEFNTDLPSRVVNVIDVMAHEGYPGHHTEHSLKELYLFRNKGYIEHSILLVRAPESVISEGIANAGEEIIFSPLEKMFQLQRHLEDYFY